VAALLERNDRTNGETLDVTVFSSSWKDRLEAPAGLPNASVVDRRIPVAALNLAWHRLGWPPAELVAGKRFDIAHSLHPLLMPARSAAQVITIHDLNFLSFPERTRAEIRRDYPALVGPHAARADRIIVSSRFAAGEVERQLGVSNECVSVCPMGAPDWTPRSGIPADGYLLFVGTLEPRKNVGKLLDAYECLLSAAQTETRSANGVLSSFRLPELILAGKALPETHGWIERIARPPLAGRVRHLGYVNPSEMRRLYVGARLLVLPSLEEGFGIPALEAMTVGVPVVATDRGALPEVVGDAGLLVEPEDAGSLAEAIRRLLTDDALAGACAAKGALRARQFRWETTAERVVEAYTLAMKHRAARARTS
jgi:glycosyltransferase involved in cell wall biosynthesis